MVNKEEILDIIDELQVLLESFKRILICEVEVIEFPIGGSIMKCLKIYLLSHLQRKNLYANDKFLDQVDTIAGKFGCGLRQHTKPSENNADW